MVKTFISKQTPTHTGGKERTRVVKDEGVPMKRVRRVVDCWVYGPNPKYQLEAGESELVTKAVWVSVPMW